MEDGRKDVRDKRTKHLNTLVNTGVWSAIVQGIFFFSPVEIDKDLFCSKWEKCVVPILSRDFF